MSRNLGVVEKVRQPSPRLWQAGQRRSWAFVGPVAILVELGPIPWPAAGHGDRVEGGTACSGVAGMARFLPRVEMTRGGSGKEQVWLDEQREGFLLSYMDSPCFASGITI